MVMSMEQELSFTAFCGTKKLWDKAPLMRLPNSQHSCGSKHNRKTCGRYLHPLLELGFCRSGRMLLPPGPTETCWLDAAYGGLQSLMSSQQSKLLLWRFSNKRHVAKELQMLKFGSSHWSSRKSPSNLIVIHLIFNNFCGYYLVRQHPPQLDPYSTAFQMMEDLWWAFGLAFVIGHPKNPRQGHFHGVFKAPHYIFYFAPC